MNDLSGKCDKDKLQEAFAKGEEGKLYEPYENGRKYRKQKPLAVTSGGKR